MKKVERDDEQVIKDGADELLKYVDNLVIDHNPRLGLFMLLYAAACLGKALKMRKPHFFRGCELAWAPRMPKAALRRPKGAKR